MFIILSCFQEKKNSLSCQSWKNEKQRVRDEYFSIWNTVRTQIFSNLNGSSFGPAFDVNSLSIIIEGQIYYICFKPPK